MAGNPMLRRLSVRARAWGSPCSSAARNSLLKLLKGIARGLVRSEVVGGGASEYGDPSDSSLDVGTSASHHSGCCSHAAGDVALCTRAARTTRFEERLGRSVAPLAPSRATPVRAYASS